jgi:hypothetical protein
MHTATGIQDFLNWNPRKLVERGDSAETRVSQFYFVQQKETVRAEIVCALEELVRNPIPDFDVHGEVARIGVLTLVGIRFGETVLEERRVRRPLPSCTPATGDAIAAIAKIIANVSPSNVSLSIIISEMVVT